MWRNGTKGKYVFMFPQKNLARKGLKYRLPHTAMFPESDMGGTGQDNWTYQTTWWGHVFTNTGTCYECVQQSTLSHWSLDDVTTICLSSSQLLFCYWWPVCCEIALKSIPQDLIDGKSTLVRHQAIAWTNFDHDPWRNETCQDAWACLLQIRKAMIIL